MVRSALVALLAAALPAFAADDAFTLKLYKDKAGDVAKVTKVMKSDGRVLVLIGETKDEQKQKGSQDVAFTETVHEWPADAKRPFKLTRVYEKVDKTNDAGEPIKSTLAGKTVTVERRKDTITYTVGGKPPTDEQVKELDGDFGDRADLNKHDLMPDKAVKVGDTWQITPEKVKKAMGEMKGFKFDEEKSSFTGKLVKAAKKDGVLYGTMEFAVKFVLTEFPLGPGMTATAEAGSELAFAVVIDGCLDGTSPGKTIKMTMTIAMKAKLPNDGKLDIATTATGTETEEPVAKKK